MTGGIEAAADAVAGGLVARTVEPRAGEGGRFAGEACLNCGTALIGRHCHACGQAGHVHRTVGAIGHEIAHGVFHFDGKIWRTLPLLVLRPGELTRRYVDGERARFVSPLAIFLFTVFLMFAVVANLPGWALDGGDLFNAGGVSAAREKVSEERARAQKALGEARAALATERARPTVDPDRLRRRTARLADAEKAVRDLTVAERALPTTVAVEFDGPGGTWLEKRWHEAQANPKLLIYKVKTSAYKYSWALIPISLPFIWLLFPFRRDVSMYDHAVFATYSLTFMSLLVIVLAVLAALGVSPDLVSTAAIVIAPAHLYKQLRYGYRLTRGGALWRTFWMIVFVSITVPLFALLLLYLGAG